MSKQPMSLDYWMFDEITIILYWSVKMSKDNDTIMGKHIDDLKHIDDSLLEEYLMNADEFINAMMQPQSLISENSRKLK